MKRNTKIKTGTVLVLLIVIDQIVKNIIKAEIVNKSIQIIPNILKFSYVQNTGIAYGLGSESVILVIFTNIFILTALAIIWYKKRKELYTAIQYAFAIIMAGGISNLIDRIFRGYVIDFIDFNQVIEYPIFNIADIFIVVGLFIIIAITLGNIVKLQENNIS